MNKKWLFPVVSAAYVVWFLLIKSIPELLVSTNPYNVGDIPFAICLYLLVVVLAWIVGMNGAKPVSGATGLSAIAGAMGLWIIMIPAGWSLGLWLYVAPVFALIFGALGNYAAKVVEKK